MTQREIRKITPTLLAIAAALFLAMMLGGCGRHVPPVSQSQPSATSSDTVAAPSEPQQPAPAALPAEPAAQTAAPEGDPLTRAQAEAIALNHAGLTAGQVKGLYSEFDIDDGVKEWDVEFRHDGWEYDYEINAVSGKIRTFDKERD